MNTYDVGTPVIVSTADNTEPGFVDNTTGSSVLTDPTTVQLLVTINEANPIIFQCSVAGGVAGSTSVVEGVWPLAATSPVTITRVSVGVFTAVLSTSNLLLGDATIALPGEWIYEWIGSGNIQAVKPNIFLVTTYPN